MNVHATISFSSTGEVRVEYIGPDRQAAQKAYETPAADSAGVWLVPFLDPQRIRKLMPAAPEPALKKK
jgi:hypothetical protein